MVDRQTDIVTTNDQATQTAHTPHPGDAEDDRMGVDDSKHAPHLQSDRSVSHGACTFNYLIITIILIDLSGVSCQTNSRFVIYIQFYVYVDI